MNRTPTKTATKPSSAGGSATCRSRSTFSFHLAPEQAATLRVQNLEPDFGAIVTPGLELAFDERVHIELDGHTLKGERARRKIPICGAAAFVVLKALAFADRSEKKDAYDLVYVIRHTPGRGSAIAEQLQRHAERHSAIVSRALGLLARDFNNVDNTGPRRAAEFAVIEKSALDDAAADAHGFVDDLLRATADLGLDLADV